MSRGDAPTSPWGYIFNDPWGLRLRCGVFFDEQSPTRELLKAGLDRDDGCWWTHVLLGRENSPFERRIAGPADGEGPRIATQGQLNAVGLFTLSDFMALQITAIHVE